MAEHKLNVIFNDATDSLTVTHVCAVPLSGHNVSHAETVQLTDEAVGIVKKVLKGIIDGPTIDVTGDDGEPVKVEAANRVEMERRTTEYAIQHVAAVLKQAKPGLKHLHLGGSVGAMGDVSAKPKE